MNLRVSRLWHRQYSRPRRAGKFLRGWTLWTRHDGVSRWVYFPNDDAPLQIRQRAAWLTEQNHRVIRDLAVIVVAAALLFWLS
jgi:hypothetical protein